MRIWHWVNAAAILVLIVTGYFIGSPPPTMIIGEAYEQFVFGYIRFAHFAAGWVLTIGFLGRIYWAFFGNHHARQLFYVPFWSASFWAEVWYEIRWYLFLAQEPRSTSATILWRSWRCSSSSPWRQFHDRHRHGALLRSAQEGSLTHNLFGWVHGLTWNSQRLHTLHHLGMWWIVIFMIIHIYVAVREDIMSRQSIVSTMISGHRTFKDDRED